ncbi:MAG: hypothetical protein ACRCV9_09235, partial [Burkholderiaceae bacterium]
NFDFLAKFRKMSAAEWVAWQQETQHVLKNMRESTALDPAAAIPGSRDIELCRRVLHGWQMVDENGVEIPFDGVLIKDEKNPDDFGRVNGGDNFEALIADHPVPQFISLAYGEFMGKASLKPSNKPQRG